MNKIIQCFYWQYFYYGTRLKNIINRPEDLWFYNNHDKVISEKEMKMFLCMAGLI